MRASGTPLASQVDSVIACGSGTPSSIASRSHRSNSVAGTVGSEVMSRSAGGPTKSAMNAGAHASADDICAQRQTKLLPLAPAS